MADTAMDKHGIDRALRALGEHLDWHSDVDITLVGGAALMLTGQVDRRRVTTDCDVIDYLPQEAMAAVEIAGEKVADELGLDHDWLNSKVQIRLDTLPDGWKERRIHCRDFGRLRVFALSRPDLIAMKVIANRGQDRQDLDEIKVRHDEAEFVRNYLDGLADKGTKQDQINDARLVLESLKLYD